MRVPKGTLFLFSKPERTGIFSPRDKYNLPILSLIKCYNIISLDGIGSPSPEILND